MSIIKIPNLIKNKLVRADEIFAARLFEPQRVSQQKNFIREHFPILIFHIVFLIIVFANFPTDKFLTGWDNLNPEFNFGLNLSRSFFASWQENYGLGTLTGHAFATMFPHIIITYLFSLFLPIWAVRSSFTFLCLYLGGLGMYFLMRNILINIFHKSEIRSTKSETNSNNQNTNDRNVLNFENYNLDIVSNFDIRYSNLIAYVPLFSALFYILNLGTVQIFYIQFEPFIAHFAALPWLFWGLLKFLENKSKKTLLIFIFINFFATIQAVIPSMFVSYIAALLIFLGVYIFHYKFSRKAIFNFLSVVFITFITNAYWFLPFLYYQIKRNQVYLNSYNNLLSTPYFIDINKKYGTFENVAILKGYLFDSFQLGDYILKPWINHYNNILTSLLAYSFFTLIFIGIMYFAIVKRNFIINAFSAIFLFFFVVLGTGLPLLSIITSFLQYASPTFQQAFRTAFTKFSIGLSFSYSIFFGFGILIALTFLSGRFKKRINFVLAAIFALIILYSLPAFQGSFLYKELNLKIPQAYFDMMDFFKNKEDARIADFPQDCPEGWYAYKWGYFGSGFYWYGIKQPFMSRSFDVWASQNENYYWEINKALHAKDFDAVDNIMQKYDIKWILYDPNLNFCRDQKSIWNNEDLVNHLDTSFQYKLAKTFQSDKLLPVRLYENVNYKAKTFVSIAYAPKNVGPMYTWNDNDNAFKEEGTYVTKKDKSFDTYYPFRELFTKTSLNDFKVEKTQDSIVFSTILPENLTGDRLTMGDFTKQEKNVPILVQFRKNAKPGFYDVLISLQFPAIYLDQNLISNPNPEQKIGEIKASKLSDISVVINGENAISDKTRKDTFIGNYYFEIDNTIKVASLNDQLLTTSNKSQQAYLNNEYDISIPKFSKGKLSVVVPKVADKKMQGIEFTKGLSNLTPVFCEEPTPSKKNDYEVGKTGDNEYIRLISQNDSQCVNVFLSGLVTDFSYLLEIQSRHVAGNNAKFSIFNKDRLVYNETTLPNSSDLQSNYFIIPPTFPNEISYTFVFKNSSKSNEKTVNEFAGINMWHVPYNFMKEIKIDSLSPRQTSNGGNNLMQINHPNESLYILGNLPNINLPTTLVLSQSYEDGWKAYEVRSSKFEVQNWINMYFPFVFGKEIKEHVLVNNWANGWEINNSGNESIVIIFWPQYLEFLGFIILVLAILDLVLMFKKSYHK
ncbi:MAG: hypothetical protein M1450_04560 [Patescibacteria group bacterium]|nr:hypothetical protein [Patescibacteria group bacterium]